MHLWNGRAGDRLRSRHSVAGVPAKLAYDLGPRSLDNSRRMERSIPDKYWVQIPRNECQVIAR